jgi:hypothetical protein
MREKIAEKAQPESNKYDNILRASTPGKMRSVSRSNSGRTTTPGKLRGNPSPARSSRCSTSSNDSDNSSRVAQRMMMQREIMPETSVQRVPSKDVARNTVEVKTTSVLPPPAVQQPVQQIHSVIQQSDAAIQPPKPPVAEEVEKRTPLKMKRLSMMDSDQETRKTIECNIHSTWKEVDVTAETKTPISSSFLGAFAYYSPPAPSMVASALADIVSPQLAEEDYVSCAGDLGADDHHDHNMDDSMQLQSPERKESNEGEAPALPSISEGDDQLDMPAEIQAEHITEKTASDAPGLYSSPQKRPLGTVSSASKRKSYTPNNGIKNATNNAAKSRLMGSIRPVFPDGKTLGESSVIYDNSLRTYNGAAGSHRHPATDMKKQPKKDVNEFSPMKGHRRTSSFKDMKDVEGRPSIGTITSQWEFMRSNFVNNSDEELEWLMVSKRSGAYTYAHRKTETAEDRYFKSLYEIDMYENKLQNHFLSATAKFPSLLQELSSHYSVLMATPKDENLGNVVAQVYKKLNDYLEENKANDLFVVFPVKFQTALTGFISSTGGNEDKFKLVRKARDLYQLYQTELFNAQTKFAQVKKDSEEALKNMEKWAKRELETDEYPAAMRKQEDDFMAKEYSENLKALNTLRSYFPNPLETKDNKSINEMTVPEIQEEYVNKSGLISFELIQELKNNKLLQWVTTHPDDIAYSNFLNGEKKSYFENIEGLDIVELRAIAMILPSKFENDNDNKKSEWRNRFMSRLKNIVSQFNHEKVKGCWDGAHNCRMMVTLPALKPDQLRRPVYYFRTKEQSDVKLKQYNDKLALLTKKKTQFDVAEKEAKEAKEEFHTLLQEMRDPDIIALIGAEKITRAKEQAKNDWNSKEKTRKTLQQDVARIEKQIRDAPMNRDQFVEKENELKEFLQERGIDWEVKGQSPALVRKSFVSIESTSNNSLFSNLD